MKNQPVPRIASNVFTRVSGEWSVVRRVDNGVYKDRDSGRVGYGNTYGERSFNQRPVHADPITDKSYTIGQKAPRKTSKNQNAKD